MRIYLLNPPYLENFNRCGRWPGAVARGGTLDYPKWLAYCTAVLSQTYKNLRLIDAPAKRWNSEAVLKDAIDFQPDLIVVESNFTSLNNDIEITSRLKEKIPHAKTVLVGPTVPQFTELILNHAGIDFVARYEYEFTIKDLADALASSAPIETVMGISYKKNNKVIFNPDRPLTTSEDLEQMPFVSIIYRDYLDIKDYYLSQSLYPEVQIFTGRGCPFKCTFCSWPENLMGRVYRSRSPQNIASEFEFIQKNMPEVREIFIEDDTFTINSKFVREFCEELMKRNIHLTWSCNARATLDYDTLKVMKKAGCRLLIVGYESGNDSILKTIKKGTNLERMREFTKNAKKVRLMVHADFIIGLPGETNETVQNTLKFIKEIKPNILQVAIATPIPGTDFYDWAKTNNHLLVNDLKMSVDDRGIQRCIISYPDFTDADIQNAVSQILKKYYLSPSFIPIAIDNVLRKNGLHELIGMMESAKTFVKYMRD